jgi:hypothetical protein
MLLISHPETLATQRVHASPDYYLRTSLYPTVISVSMRIVNVSSGWEACRRDGRRSGTWRWGRVFRTNAGALRPRHVLGGDKPDETSAVLGSVFADNGPALSRLSDWRALRPMQTDTGPRRSGEALLALLRLLAMYRTEKEWNES